MKFAGLLGRKDPAIQLDKSLATPAVWLSIDQLLLPPPEHFLKVNLAPGTSLFGLSRTLKWGLREVSGPMKNKPNWVSVRRPAARQDPWSLIRNYRGEEILTVPSENIMHSGMKLIFYFR